MPRRRTSPCALHPTTDDYERVTGRPWFTSGAVVGGELHLLPLAVLRDRGVLERTIRHELVHLMTDAALGGRPAWVREGAGDRTSPASRLDPAASRRSDPAFKPRRAPRARTTTSCCSPVSVGALQQRLRAAPALLRETDRGLARTGEDVE